MEAASSKIRPSSACGSIAISGIPCISSSSTSLKLMEIFGNSTDILSSEISTSSADDATALLLIIGVNAGDGKGVGISLIGERHLPMAFGISKSIVGGCKKLLLVLCALSGSSTGTSMVLCLCSMGLSGGLLENDIGVCIDDVVESSSPAMSS